MEENRSKNLESIYTSKIKAGKRRTYFFDVRQTKGQDYFVTITESTKKFNRDGYERHKIFLYKEDFNRFQNGLNEVINHIKTELMPDFDYEQYERRHAEWEKEEKERIANGEVEPSKEVVESAPQTTESDETSEEDIAW